MTAHQRYGDDIKPYPQLIEGVLILWRRGMNTAEIAATWCMPEHVIHKALVMGRDGRR